MRRVLLVLVAMVLLSSCKNGGLTIYAPAELAQGTIFIDGRQAGHFDKTQRLYRWVGWSKMRKELGAPPRSETIAVLPAVAPGRHELRIEKTGYQPIDTNFNYSTGPIDVEIDDAQLKPVAAASPQ